MKLGRRDLSTWLAAPLNARHYRTLPRMARVYPRFFDGLTRYLFARGEYPAAVEVRTPAGRIAPTLYSHDDFLTLNEVFCREDYRAGRELRTAVDFGANIGLASLYFLTRNAEARVYAFEPLARNVVRLRENLRGREARYTVREVAVGVQDGTVSFGHEPTGRYGGVGMQHLPQITVPCVDANAVLREVIGERGEIDVLKIDVEGLELPILRHLADDVAVRIGVIYAELPDAPRIRPGFRQKQDGWIVQLRRE